MAGQGTVTSWKSARDALGRACPNQRCITRAAIEDAIDHGVIPVPKPRDAWLVRLEGNNLSLRVVADGSVHTVKGRCEHANAKQSKKALTATVHYKQVPLREARAKCDISREEPGKHTTSSWDLKVGGDDIKFDVGRPANEEERKDGEQAERFAHAVARGASAS
jgi:hypothetical protein